MCLLISGGMQARLYCAFQIVLSEMFNSPILMLDEAFSGVDVGTIQECLEVICPISEHKVVLVIEHAANTFDFDKVIEL